MREREKQGWLKSTIEFSFSVLFDFDGGGLSRCDLFTMFDIGHMIDSNNIQAIDLGPWNPTFYM